METVIRDHFGIIEAVLVFGLALAFFLWQRASLKRDIARREEREAEGAADAAGETGKGKSRP